MSQTQERSIVEISHYLNAIGQQVYKKWINDVELRAMEYPGFLGLNVLSEPNADCPLTVQIVFDTERNFVGWTFSQDNKAVIEWLRKIVVCRIHLIRESKKVCFCRVVDISIN